MKRLLLLGLIIVSGTLFAEDLPTLAPFKSVCVSDQSSGFNWKGGRWTPVQFVVGEKFLVQKIDPEKYRDKPVNQRPLLCNDGKEPIHTGDLTFQYGCYLISTLGQTRPVLQAETCQEYFEGRQIKSVDCRNFVFAPDGNFIQTSTILNIDPKPKNDYKDSLFITLGTCGRLED
jgi:hypothetical protein